jgi:hypothetical protein
VRNHHLINHWVENVAAEEDGRNREIAIDHSKRWGAPILDIEGVEVEELGCLDELCPINLWGGLTIFNLISSE